MIAKRNTRNSRQKIYRGLSREKSSAPGVMPAKTLAGGSGLYQGRMHFVTRQSRFFRRRRAHRRDEVFANCASQGRPAGTLWEVC
jgi:hypothetical protein